MPDTIPRASSSRATPGGGLAVTTVLNAQKIGLPVPGGVVAFSPGLDNAGTGASNTTRAAADPILTRESVQPNRDLYRAGADPKDELLNPAQHADTTGFPPLLLQVGTNEILLDDSTRLAERARNADVDVTLDITARVPHVFQTYTGQLDEADLALERAALFIKQTLRKASH